MGELINSQHLFDLRRLEADVDRAERTHNTTPAFHRQFQQMLWGASVLDGKNYQEAQRKLNGAFSKYLDNLDFAPKPKED